MFAWDDPEALQGEIDRLREEKSNADVAHCKEIDELRLLLADTIVSAEALAATFEWKGTRARYDARGFEAQLMDELVRRRDALRDIATRARGYFADHRIDPMECASAARARRERQDILRRAAALQAEAERLMLKADGIR